MLSMRFRWDGCMELMHRICKIYHLVYQVCHLLNWQYKRSSLDYMFLLYRNVVFCFCFRHYPLKLPHTRRFVCVELQLNKETFHTAAVPSALWGSKQWYSSSAECLSRSRGVPALWPPPLLLQEPDIPAGVALLWARGPFASVRRWKTVTYAYMFNTLSGNIYLSGCVGCVCGTRCKNNPLISIWGRGQATRRAPTLVTGAKDDGPGAKAAPSYSCFASSAAGLKQTGSAHRDKSGDMYPLEPQSSAQICPYS